MSSNEKLTNRRPSNKQIALGLHIYGKQTFDSFMLWQTQV